MSNSEDVTGFGLAYIRKEGAAMHPDDTEAEMGDVFYLKQLQAFKDEHGIEVTKKSYCSRPYLLEELS